MYCKVDALFAQRMLDLRHKDTVTTELYQGYVCNVITFCADLLNSYFHAWPLLSQPLDHCLSLDHRQFAGSCSYCNVLHRFVLPGQIDSAERQHTHAPG